MLGGRPVKRPQAHERQEAVNPGGMEGGVGSSDSEEPGSLDNHLSVVPWSEPAWLGLTPRDSPVAAHRPSEGLRGPGRGEG